MKLKDKISQIKEDREELKFLNKTLTSDFIIDDYYINDKQIRIITRLLLFTAIIFLIMSLFVFIVAITNF